MSTLMAEPLQIHQAKATGNEPAWSWVKAGFPPTPARPSWCAGAMTKGLRADGSFGWTRTKCSDFVAEYRHGGHVYATGLCSRCHGLEQRERTAAQHRQGDTK